MFASAAAACAVCECLRRRRKKEDKNRCGIGRRQLNSTVYDQWCKEKERRRRRRKRCAYSLSSLLLYCRCSHRHREYTSSDLWYRRQKEEVNQNAHLPFLLVRLLPFFKKENEKIRFILFYFSSWETPAAPTAHEAIGRSEKKRENGGDLLRNTNVVYIASRIIWPRTAKTIASLLCKRS